VFIQVWGLGFGVWGLGFGIQGSGLDAQPRTHAARLPVVAPASNGFGAGAGGACGGELVDANVGGGG